MSGKLLLVKQTCYLAIFMLIRYNLLCITMKDIYRNFFEPIKYYGVKTHEDYLSIQPCIQALDAFSRLTNHCLYVIDYYKQNFLYVSSNGLFLKELDVHSMKKLGYEYYYNFVPPGDQRFLEIVNQEGFSFFYKINEDDRIDYSISYDFHICGKHCRPILINHKLTPLALNERKQIWLALCVVTLAPKRSYGEVVIQSEKEAVKHIYDPAICNWISIPKLFLTDVDVSILRLSAQGFSNKEIADLLFYDINSIKFHKRQLFKKFGVDNTIEAIAYANLHKLI